MTYSPYALVMASVAFVSVSLACYAWSRQRVPEARSLALMLLASAEWCIFYALELAAPDYDSKMLFVKLQYFGIASAPSLFLAFALRYTGRGHLLTRRNILLLVPEPVAIVLLAFTNESHRLLYTQNLLDTSGSWPLIISTWGAAGWANIAYSYALMAWVALMLWQLLLRARHKHRLKAAVLLLTTLVPWTANFMYVFDANPFRGLDLTPIGFIVMNVALASGIGGLRLVDMLSVSRTAVIEQMRDGVVLLDTGGRIMELNPSAQVLLGVPGNSANGRAAHEVWPDWPETTPSVSGAGDPAPVESVLWRGEKALEVTISPVVDWRGHLIGRVATLRDITDRRKREEDLARQYETTRSLADRDSVTGLLNHRALHERLEHEITICGRLGRPLSLALMDMDMFKRVNDTHGHPFGDRVLKHVASVLAESSRGTDVLGRYGGDEFVAILPDTQLEGAHDLVNRWQSALAKHPYRDGDDAPIYTSMSFGIAVFPTDAIDSRRLIEEADRLLYESKRQSRTRLACAPPGSTGTKQPDREP